MLKSEGIVVVFTLSGVFGVSLVSKCEVEAVAFCLEGVFRIIYICAKI